MNAQNVSHSDGGMASTIRTVQNPSKEQAATKVQQINFKEVALVATGLLFVGGLIAGYWFYTQEGKSLENAASTGSVADAQVPNTHEAKPLTAASVLPPATATVPSSRSLDTMHADVYFDFDRSRLRADAVGTLQEKAAILKQDGGWVVLIQGYADQHGPGEYNKALAARRAGAVKQFLIELGVPQDSIKVATVGQAMSICDDPGKECQRLNRRVHLEMIKRSVPAAAIDQARSSPTLLPVMAEDAAEEEEDVSVSEGETTEPASSVAGTASGQ